MKVVCVRISFLYTAGRAGISSQIKWCFTASSQKGECGYNPKYICVETNKLSLSPTFFLLKPLIYMLFLLLLAFSRCTLFFAQAISLMVPFADTNGTAAIPHGFWRNPETPSQFIFLTLNPVCPQTKWQEISWLYVDTNALQIVYILCQGCSVYILCQGCSVTGVNEFHGNQGHTRCFPKPSLTKHNQDFPG